MRQGRKNGGSEGRRVLDKVGGMGEEGSNKDEEKERRRKRRGGSQRGYIYVLWPAASNDNSCDPAGKHKRLHHTFLSYNSTLSILIMDLVSMPHHYVG